MANLTITVNDDSLKKARIRAIQEGTSVNALLKDYLASYSNVKWDQQEAVARILTVSRESKSRRGGRTWSRDELHERD